MSNRAAFGDDLVEAAVETREGVCDVIGMFRGRGWGCGGTRSGVRLRHAFKLPRQGVETLVDGGDILAGEVIVVIRLSV